MHRADTRAAQIQFDVQVEVRRVDADEHVRLGRDQHLHQVLAPAQQFAQAAEHLHQAHDGQALHRKVRLQPFGLHARTADTDELDVGVALLERLHETGAEDIAGRLARDQGDAQLACGRLHGQRVMPRVELWMESRNTATSGNCSEASPSSANASSTVRPWR